MAFCLLFSFSPLTHSKIYVWIDENGKKHVSNTGVPSNSQNAKEMDVKSGGQSFKAPPKPPKDLSETELPNETISNENSELNSDIVSETSNTDTQSNRFNKIESNSEGSKNSPNVIKIKSSRTIESREYQLDSSGSRKNITSQKANQNQNIKYQNTKKIKYRVKSRRIKSKPASNQNKKAYTDHQKQIKQRNEQIRRENARKLEAYNKKLEALKRHNDHILKKHEKKLNNFERKVSNQRTILNKKRAEIQRTKSSINSRKSHKYKIRGKSQKARSFNPYADVHGHHYGSYDGVHTGKGNSPHEDLHGNHYNSYDGVHTGKE